ncbi:recombinase family protein [Streptomyces lydicus]|uniref:recombinase family protein n=1 Tax=Streptomyces lydicus TaxID=47763 RepID=UPI003789F750
MNDDIMAPLVFIYDRCASRNHQDLDQRLTGCHTYVDRMGWVLASGGPWLDRGADALTTQRPQMTVLLNRMRAEAARREVVCLVHTLGRLATDYTHRLVLQQRIIEVGGWTCTTFGESDRHNYRAVLVGRQS